MSSCRSSVEGTNSRLSSPTFWQNRLGGGKEGSRQHKVRIVCLEKKCVDKSGDRTDCGLLWTSWIYTYDGYTLIDFDPLKRNYCSFYFTWSLS